jgi:hypothetical protein
MSQELLLLVGVAASVAFLHTLAGPDHYIPFLGMARAGGWSRRKSLWVTVFCGLGHVLGSAVLALLGLAAVVGAERIASIESYRGEIAAWGLIAFGLVYGVWGLRRAWRNKPHEHWHSHGTGSRHRHLHVHEAEHLHAHPAGRASLTPWVLFALFAFGPCEPLIPLLLYPAVTHTPATMIWVLATYALVTTATMVGIVWLGLLGLGSLRWRPLERYAHALAGAAVLACGLGVKFLGL